MKTGAKTVAKKAGGDIWIDGFNLFHQWRETAMLFQPGGDVVQAQRLALRLLSRKLHQRRGRCVVFMDGGVRCEGGTIDGVRVRYPGPGQKADDLMDEALRARQGQRNNQLTVVTSDRTLAADLRRQGARIQSAAEFISGVLNAVKPADPRNQPVDPQRSQPLLEGEVEYWLQVFDAPKDGTDKA